MNPELAVELVRQALVVAMWVALPILTAAVIVGLAVNFFQVATSMQDTAVSTVPRLAVLLLVVLISMPWMLNRLTSYTTTLFSDFARYAR